MRVVQRLQSQISAVVTMAIPKDLFLARDPNSNALIGARYVTLKEAIPAKVHAMQGFPI
jgi:hypothetical protein